MVGTRLDQDAALNPPPRSRVPTTLVERNGRMVYVVPLDLDFMAWEPARLNGIFRSLWSAVELDKDYHPIRAIWRDPSTRRNDEAPGPGVAKTARGGGRHWTGL
jgi:hypothetical protein